MLISTLFTAFPSAPVSMTMTGMGTMDSQMNHHSSQKTDGDHSAMPCCDVMGASCVSPGFITTQFDEIALSGENKRAANSNLIVHFIIIQNTTPPPSW